MIAINKAEKEAVLKRFPGLCVVRTMRQDSKRHHYYMEEKREAVQFINGMRGISTQPHKSKNNYRGRAK